MVLSLLTLALRLAQFPAIPPGFRFDESHNAVDACWLVESGSWAVYLPGNQGRGALYHHLAGRAMALFGVNLFVFRGVSMVVGWLTVWLMYLWVVTMFAPAPERHLLGLVASAGLAFSFWHIAMSRTGFRAILVPFFFALIAWLFWRGWQKNSWLVMVGAGIALGLSQYTYHPVLLFPLCFPAF